MRHRTRESEREGERERESSAIETLSTPPFISENDFTVRPFSTPSKDYPVASERKKKNFTLFKPDRIFLSSHNE